VVAGAHDRCRVRVHPGGGRSADHRADPMPRGDETADDRGALGARCAVDDDC
jgi:hypothetical protein